MSGWSSLHGQRAQYMRLCAVSTGTSERGHSQKRTFTQEYAGYCRLPLALTYDFLTARRTFSFSILFSFASGTEMLLELAELVYCGLGERSPASKFHPPTRLRSGAVIAEPGSDIRRAHNAGECVKL